jgi:hypothetical protein
MSPPGRRKRPGAEVEGYQLGKQRSLWPFRALAWANGGGAAPSGSAAFTVVPRLFWCASGAHRAHPRSGLLGSSLLAEVGALSSRI